MDEVELKLEKARDLYREMAARIAYLERLVAVQNEVLTEEGKKACSAVWATRSGDHPSKAQVKARVLVGPAG